MKLLFSYIKMKRRTIIICMLFAFIFTISFIFYRLPVTAVVYPAVLCAVSGIILMSVDFLRFKKRHKDFDEIIRLRSFLISDIPEAENLPEEDYCKIVSLLRQELSQLETGFASRYNDMTDYYTVWAHQIKTPIASMKLTLQNEDSPAFRKLTSDLFRIEQYVEMVLAFLRLDSVSTDYVFKELSADTLIKNSVKKFAPDFINKKLRLDYEETDIMLVTDEKWFSFVLEQIISNALKYTREGGIHIYTREKKLFIEDTGIGIAPEDVPRVFENGYTGINGRTDKSASGIGLYLCKRVCDNLGIGISIESKVGEGTRVCLDLEQYKLRKE